ncbi:aminotransferase class III-fold pyridoxal phosphate-dependent enzyme [Gordonia sp. SID5947]|nr:aminotransferase class III-fold pyridoxal phosphate-dependent enzyme [Gordonia sp. SID5947]MYR07947.1 aminotransferase class III-fold pyridoxal phosphate-dependent enzyme [Gordonia sp. SID5947]
MQPHPLFIDHARGSRMWDIDGNEYVDYVMGWGPLVAGHSHPRIISAVGEMLPRMQMIGMGHRLEYEAAEAVVAAIPGAEKLLWSNSGTEAVQVALRLARAASGRNTVVKFINSYHGWHDSVFASVAYHEGGEAATMNSLGQNPHAIDQLLVLPFNDIDAVGELLADAAARDIGAVLLDPVQSNSGLYAPVPGFLEKVRELCDEHGVILIFDQVIAGFRVAHGGATERYGVEPDLSVLGKAIAGGFAQAAVVGRAPIIDLVTQGVFHAGTYNGNPIALAAVQATMDLLNEPRTFEGLDSVASGLRTRLVDAFAESSRPFEVRRIGSLLAIDEQAGDRPPIWSDLTGELVNHGILALPSGKVFVSTEHTHADSDRFAEGIRAALRVVDAAAV